MPDYQELNRLLSFLGRVDGQNIFKWYYAVSIKEGMEKNIGKDLHTGFNESYLGLE